MRLWGDGVVNLQSLFPFLGQWTRYTRFAQLLHWNLGLFTEFMADYSNLITLPACISQWLGVLAGSVTSHRVRAETKLFIFQNKGHLSTGRVPVGTRPSAWFCHSATVFIHRYCQSVFLKNVHNVALKMLEACFKVAYFLNCAHLAWKGVNTWQELLLEHAEPLWINSTSLQPQLQYKKQAKTVWMFSQTFSIRTKVQHQTSVLFFVFFVLLLFLSLAGICMMPLQPLWSHFIH